MLASRAGLLGRCPRPSARSKLRPALRAERTRVSTLFCEAAAKPKSGVLSRLDERDLSGGCHCPRLISADEGDKYPLRLCPNASIPSDVVSRCTWPGQGSRTSRTANTMSRGNGVKGHTRSGADDEFRTRGLDHGVVALFLMSAPIPVALRQPPEGDEKTWERPGVFS